MFLFGFIAYSCTKDNDDKNPQPQNVQINIQMVHMVGDQDVVFDTIKYTNSFGNNYSVVRLQYFIADFIFQKSDGNEYKLDAEQYIDAVQDGMSSAYLFSTELPSGDYNSISFIFGIDSTKNNPGRYPNPPESLMEWPAPLGGGYHYMKLEGKFNQNDTIKNYQYHSGPTMGNPNYVEVSLPASSFSASGSMMTITIQMDINKWFDSPHILDLNEISGIMGNQPIQLKIKANGANVFSLESIE
jgi:hypothetical protein